MNTTQSKDYLAKKAALQKKTEERAAWHRLVVKVISWSDGLVNNGVVTQNNKITFKEWRTYVERSLLISKDGDISKIKSKLKETEELIKKFNGFIH